MKIIDSQNFLPRMNLNNVTFTLIFGVYLVFVSVSAGIVVCCICVRLTSWRGITSLGCL